MFWRHKYSVNKRLQGHLPWLFLIFFIFVFFLSFLDKFVSKTQLQNDGESSRSHSLPWFTGRKVQMLELAGWEQHFHKFEQLFSSWTFLLTDFLINQNNVQLYSRIFSQFPEWYLHLWVKIVTVSKLWCFCAEKVVNSGVFDIFDGCKMQFDCCASLLEVLFSSISLFLFHHGRDYCSSVSRCIRLFEKRSGTEFKNRRKMLMSHSVFVWNSIFLIYIFAFHSANTLQDTL